MTAGAPSLHPLMVPREPTFLGARREPVAVTLPLACRPRRGLMAAYAAFLLGLAALGLVLILAAVVLERSWLQQAVLIGLGGLVAVSFGPAGLTMVGDALRPGPALVIAADGLEDRRQGLRIGWGEVREARLRPSRVGVAHVALWTAEGGRKPGSRFRIGAHRRRGDDVVVPVQFLAPGPEVSALAIARLLEGAGVAVQAKPYWA